MPSGIIVIDKPQDWTSMDVCAKLKGALGERRIGHAGTLDPMATGVLPVFVGRATRAVEFATVGDKEYLAGLRLGLVTDTQDTTGTTLSQSTVTIDPPSLETALAPFRGDILQIPPMYSAIKIGGKKLYELARKGQEVARKPRPVTIYSLTVETQTGPCDFLLRVRCSKGTYVRTLCHDIGAALGCGGTMSSLRRTMAAGFTLAESVTLPQLLQAAQEGTALDLLSGVDRCFAHLPALTATQEQRDRFIRNGTPYPAEDSQGEYRVYGPDGAFLMVGQVAQGRMTTVKSFFDVSG